MSNRKVASAVRLTLVAAGALGAGLYGAAGLAQQAPQGQTALQEIVVTGSRIASPTVESTSPVSVVSAADVKLTGATKAEDLINKLPQVFATYGSTVSNGSTGTATVDLRGLGPSRTLVLVNGRRLPAGDPGYVPADLNQIPAPLIERVEVLTGGASAVYGSDAVSGVVNFIMNDHFEGAQFDASLNFYNHTNSSFVSDIVSARGFALPSKNIGSDGKSKEISLLLGSNFADGKGNATIYFGYENTDALLQKSRDYSACSLGAGAAGFRCAGSYTSYPGYFYDLNTGGGYTVADSNGTVRAFNPSTDLFNYGPYNYYQRPDDRYTVAAYAHYNFNENNQLYTEFNFMDDHTVAQIAPSGLFGLTTTISCANPLLSQSWLDTICPGYDPAVDPTQTADMFIMRRNIEGGGRQDDLRHTSYRGVVGFKGTFADNWNYDLSGQYGTVIYQENYLNDFSQVRATRAMNVVTDPNTGLPVCASVLDGTDPNCVPYNIWSLGGVTPQALAYLQTPGFQKGWTKQTVVTGTLSSDLGKYGVKLPTANDGVSMVLGAEYREESLQLRTDVEFDSGDLFGQGGPTHGVEGGYNVKDYFTEIRAPIMQDKPMFKDLSFDGSYRYSDYSTGVTTSTYGLGLNWAMIDDFKLRGSFQHAVRAPNIIELFRTAGIGLYNMDTDPCSGAVDPATGVVAGGATAAQCANTGVTAAQYGHVANNPAGQFNALFGGNVNLQPEKADSYTFGFVFTPTFVDNLTVTVDYFNIKVKDVISSLSPTTTLSGCLDSGNPLFCDLIHRDSRGTLWATPDAYIVSTNINLSTLKTSGVDLSANYGFGLGRFGSMNMNLMGTYLDKYTVEEIPGEGSYDCAGLYGNTCGNPNPQWRHNMRATWSTPWNLDVSLTWRYFDKVKLDTTSSNPKLAGTTRAVNAELKAQSYLDLAASYTLLKNYNFTVGINNLLDKDPPITAVAGAPFGNGNTYPGVYDALGRYVFMRVSAKF